jgi:glycine dehydrogenase
MLRYMRTLESRDLSLVHSMIPLGSCTMKLNATAEMMPSPGALRAHPSVRAASRRRATRSIVKQLEAMLAEITGFPRLLQPNAGAQGELRGAPRHPQVPRERGEGQRDVCLIPASAHGTNPASAVMAGMRVVVVACDEKGYVDLADLEAKAKEHAKASRRS